MKRIIFCLLLLGLCGPAYAKVKKQPVKTVDSVDIAQCMGTWYEIARITHWFERDLMGVAAVYTLLPNGNIEMVNSGYKGSLKGKYISAKGNASITDKNTNAKLNACFFWPFYRQYWILEVGKQYEYAVIGHPSLKYLWILSRAPTMREGLYRAILKRAAAQGFDISLLEKALPRIASKRHRKETAE